MSFSVTGIFKESLIHVFKNRAMWLKIAAVPFLFHILARPFEKAADGFFSEGINAIYILEGSILYFLAFILAVIGNSIWSVYGYRYGIFNKEDNLKISVRACLLKMISYTFLYILFLISFALCGFAFFFISELILDDLRITIPLLSFLTLFAVYFFIRLSLTFPMVAIEQSTPLRKSWQMTKGSILPITLFFLLTGFFIISVGCLVYFVTIPFASFVHPFVLIAAALLLFYIIFIYYSSMIFKGISLIYLSLTEEKG